MDELFAPGGRLAAVFPSFEPRPQPAAAAALGRDVRVAVIKGRENYLCRKSLHGLELLRGSAGALLADADDAATLEGLRGWIESTETGDRAELPFEPSASLWAEPAVRPDRRTGRPRAAGRAGGEERLAPPARALAELDRRAEGLFHGLDPGRGRRRLTEADVDGVVATGFPVAVALAQLAEVLAGSGEEPDALARRALAAAETLETCLAVGDPARVSWAEPAALAWAPVDVSDVLRETLWESDVTCVLVSATLEPRFLRGRLGLDEAREAVFPSPFDYREQALVYVPAAFPEPRAPGYFHRLADEVVALCGLSRGRALVLTSSYRALDELAERARGRLPYPLLRQGEAPRERLLDRFRAEVDSVLFATATFWQGVDVRGESLSLLVIDKLPFAAPGDPLVEARSERIARAGGDWFGEYALPSAVLQLRQGFGRLIRGHGDRGVVAVLDPRLRTRAYGRRFLEALPPCPVVADPGSVADFFGVRASASA